MIYIFARADQGRASIAVRARDLNKISNPQQAKMADSVDYFSKKYIDGVYIPSGLLIFGCWIVKSEWLPYAVALAVTLGGWKFWSNSKCCASCQMGVACYYINQH